MSFLKRIQHWFTGDKSGANPDEAIAKQFQDIRSLMAEFVQDETKHLPPHATIQRKGDPEALKYFMEQGLSRKALLEQAVKKYEDLVKVVEALPDSDERHETLRELHEMLQHRSEAAKLEQIGINLAQAELDSLDIAERLKVLKARSKKMDSLMHQHERETFETVEKLYRLAQEQGLDEEWLLRDFAAKSNGVYDYEHDIAPMLSNLRKLPVRKEAVEHRRSTKERRKLN